MTVAVVACGRLGGFVLDQSAPLTRIALTLPAARAEARRLGLPTFRENPARRDERPALTLAPAENAAPVYAAITAQIGPGTAAGSGRAALDGFLGPSRTDSDRREVRRLLARLEPPMRRAEQASRRPVCHFDAARRDKQGEIEMGILFTILDLTKLFAARALLESEAGDPAVAVHTLRIAGSINDHLSSDPGAMSFLTRAYGNVMLLRVLREVLLAHRDAGPSLRGPALRVISRCGLGRRHLRDALRSYVLGTVSLAAEMRHAVYSPPSDPWLDWDPFWRAMDRLRFDLEVREATDALEAIALLHGADVERQLRTVRESADLVNAFREVKRLEAAAVERRGAGVAGYARPIVFSFSLCVFHVLRNETESQLTRTLLALLLHEQANGAQPERLEDLGRAKPETLDPFSGKPLRYRRRAGGGFVLWSVGANARDDHGRAASGGGTAPDQGSGGVPDDISASAVPAQRRRESVRRSG